MHDNYWVNGYYIFYLNNKQGINVKSQKKENFFYYTDATIEKYTPEADKINGELINNLNNKST